ncbi:MAG TPA: TIGR03086 family metal-binding protein [Acidimicrobiales bacterium]|nr:TIGR03086 family metal-binding protein [Acidimicrobiales bacterium]
MEPLDVLTAARADFRRRLSAVGPDQWDLPTPCADWDVRDLVAHLVRGNYMAELLLHGTSRDDTLAAMAEPVPDDLATAFDASADRQQAAFEEPGSLERTCHHPVGDIPGAQLLGFRIGDMALHAWDLARSIGADDSLDVDVVAAMWDAMAPMAPFIGETGFFGAGPSGAVPEDAPLQLRVLDLSGRRP